MRRFWRATRPYSFTAALVPVLLGALASGRFSLLWFALALVGAVAIQTVANVVNDLFDARSGLDRLDNTGAMNVVVTGELAPAEGWRIVAVAGTVATLAGGLALGRVGTPLVPWLVGGALVAFFYTAPPIALKHRALGDAAVAAGFGVGVAAGSAMIALGGPLTPLVSERLSAWAAPPLMLVVAILHANNLRDREADRAGAARTVANVLPESFGRALLVALVMLPYFWQTGLALTTREAWTVLPMLTLPIGANLAARAQAGNVGGTYVPEIAKLHGAFGVLAAIALAIVLR